jgi:DNA recombination protein RmuC
MELLIIAFAIGTLIGAAVAGISVFVCLRQGDERTLGAILEQLRSTADQSRNILQETTTLNAALSNPILRGDWGERMVEDVLRPIGFLEGLNYLKQETMDCGSGRPDYTFLLPRGLKVNLDSKFSWSNYQRYYNAKTEGEKEQCRKYFLRDVRDRVKHLASKDYINPSEGTLDFVLMFVPNEQIYSFINEHDRELLEDALTKKVVLCSPWSLYPVLSIIRQAVENFVLERNATALQPLLAAFDKQWKEYKDCQGKMGQKIEEAKEQFDLLVGTRERQLGKALRQIEILRQRTDFHSMGDGEAKVVARPTAPQVAGDGDQNGRITS